MFVTNWISTTKIQKISEITNFFRHYFLSRTEVTSDSLHPVLSGSTRGSYLCQTSPHHRMDGRGRVSDGGLSKGMQIHNPFHGKKG